MDKDLSHPLFPPLEKVFRVDIAVGDGIPDQFRLSTLIIKAFNMVDVVGVVAAAEDVTNEYRLRNA